MGKLAASPASQAVAIGESVPITVRWTGLTAGRRYLGLVSFRGGNHARVHDCLGYRLTGRKSAIRACADSRLNC